MTTFCYIFETFIKTFLLAHLWSKALSQSCKYILVCQDRAEKFGLFCCLETLLKKTFNAWRWVITVNTKHRFQCPDYFRLPSCKIIQHKINGLLCILTKRTTCLCRIIPCNINGLLCILTRGNICLNSFLVEHNHFF